MTQHINLYNASLRRQRQWLTATSLALASLALLTLMVGWTLSARSQLSALEDENRVAAPKVKALRAEVTALTGQSAALKPDARLEADLASARGLLAMRGEVLAVLQKGIGGGTVSVGEYLRALARQSVSGLWLTSFKVGEGGAGLEIGGAMTDPALLPLYIRKLNAEAAFQGRAFAALRVSAGELTATGSTSVPKPASAPAVAAPYHKFLMTPQHAPEPRS